MAGGFMISTATLAIRTPILPRWITLPGYALAALLLLSSRFSDWLPLAGMLWSKQFYYFDADKWLEEHGVDPFVPGGPSIRNRE
jgi:hypothetical protein